MISKASSPKASSESPRVAPVADAGSRSGMSGIGDELAVARQELAVARSERDDYRQEMFESNRYAAWLTHQVRISNEAPTDRLSVEPSAELTDYIAYLEDRLWMNEDTRLEAANYIRYLEDYCWKLETRRLADSDVTVSRR